MWLDIMVPNLGRNVAGLMFGLFNIRGNEHRHDGAVPRPSIPTFSAKILWVMSPLASTLCLLVWTVSLWELAPVPKIVYNFASRREEIPKRLLLN